MYRLQDSRIGRSWNAIREDELAAAANGINTVTTKLLAFSLGATTAGLAGVYNASKLTIVSPDQFLFTVSFTVLAMVILGGMGNIWGVAAGAFIVYMIQVVVLKNINAVLEAIHFPAFDLGPVHIDLVNVPFVALDALASGRGAGVLAHARVRLAVNTAEAAIDAALAVAEKKVHIFPPPPMPLRQRPHARVALAKAEMTWRAARAFTYETADRIWEEAQSQGGVSPDTRRAMALSLSYSFRAAREVAQSMYDLVGPTAVFSAKTPLDRLLRDAITMSEHLLLSDSFLEMVGAGIVGDPPQIGWL